MKSLQDKQRQWIKDRDKQTDEDAAYYEDGSFAIVQRSSTLGQLTEQRCYELVKKICEVKLKSETP